MNFANYNNLGRQWPQLSNLECMASLELGPRDWRRLTLAQDSTASLVRSQLHRHPSQPPSTQDLARALLLLHKSVWRDFRASSYSGSQLSCETAAQLVALNLPSLGRLAVWVPTMDAAVMATLLHGQWRLLYAIHLELEVFGAGILAQLAQRHWPSL